MSRRETHATMQRCQRITSLDVGTTTHRPPRGGPPAAVWTLLDTLAQQGGFGAGIHDLDLFCHKLPFWSPKNILNTTVARSDRRQTQRNASRHSQQLLYNLPITILPTTNFKTSNHKLLQHRRPLQRHCCGPAQHTLLAAKATPCQASTFGPARNTP